MSRGHILNKVLEARRYGLQQELGKGSRHWSRGQWGQRYNGLSPSYLQPQSHLPGATWSHGERCIGTCLSMGLAVLDVELLV